MRSVDLGHFGVSFWELLILFEQWAGHRLLREKVTRPHARANRPTLMIPSVPVSEGIEIRQGCQFISSLVRALSKLPGGLGRFLPCGVGPHLSRLRHLGWNQCYHGLTSRPLESCHHQCLKAVCGVLGYPEGSAAELLGGSLKLKRSAVTSVNLLDCRGNYGKRVLLTRKTRPGASSHVNPDPGHFHAEEMEKIAFPFLRKSGEARWACLALFFLALGLGDFLHWDAWNLHWEATGVVGYRLDSPAEGTGALAPVRFN